MSSLFDFRTVHHGGLTWHVHTAGDSDIPEACWPGLTREYSADRESNPFWRFSVNNVECELFAVWRAMAWTMCDAPHRLVIPRFDRDQAARFLGREPASLAFITWEYDFNWEVDQFEKANRGFVPARSSIPMSPPASDWERDHRDLAGLLPISSLAELHRIDAAISFDVASEMTIFGVEHTVDELQAVLSTDSPPQLPEVLGPTGVMAHLAIVRDRFLGYQSYLAITSTADLHTAISALSARASTRWSRYLDAAPSLDHFDDFATAMNTLLDLG